MANRKFSYVLITLLVMIVTLMALGAGVRTMNAGLSCPDWPLCYGKVIPDFHPTVWFEFVHRAYAGLVAILFVGCFAYVLSLKSAPRAAKTTVTAALFFLLMQIVAGALTVLMVVKWVAVTSHLMLATFFFCTVFWTLQLLRPAVELGREVAPRALRFVTGLLSFLILAQILLGGIVASTYAGSVCVDWPLCNGQWVPTMSGAIGHQISHRFMAYFLAFAITIYAAVIQGLARREWMTPQLLRLSRLNLFVVFAQVGIGIANLVLFIPPSVTVVHQSMAIILLAVNLRTYFVSRVVCETAVAARKTEPISATTSAYPVDSGALLS